MSYVSFGIKLHFLLRVLFSGDCSKPESRDQRAGEYATGVRESAAAKC